MAKFRSKPTVIEAEKFTGPEHIGRKDPTAMFSIAPKGVEYDLEHPDDHYLRAFVTTAHGQRVYLAEGDWVTPEPNGKGYYPIKPDIMTTRYDPIDAPANPRSGPGSCDMDPMDPRNS